MFRVTLMKILLLDTFRKFFSLIGIGVYIYVWTTKPSPKHFTNHNLSGRAFMFVQLDNMELTSLLLLRTALGEALKLKFIIVSSEIQFSGSSKKRIL